MKLNVFKSFLTPIIYHLEHPIIFARHFWKALKCSYERITKGYCSYDVWNLNDWLLSILPEMFDKLRTEGHGYPCYGEINTIEKWEEHLKYLAIHLRELQKNNWEKRNEYADIFYRIPKPIKKTKEGIATFFGDAEYDEEIKEKFIAREKELAAERMNLLKEIGLLIFENLDNYWD